jgi:hypothetical protein
MPFPVAAAIVWGMIAGGGLAGAGAALQRLYNYLLSTKEEQDLEDQKLTPFLKPIVSVPSFGKTPDRLPVKEQKQIEAEVKTIAPRLRKQLNEAAKANYGKVFSRLSKAQKEALLHELAKEYKQK